MRRDMQQDGFANVGEYLRGLPADYADGRFVYSLLPFATESAGRPSHLMAGTLIYGGGAHQVEMSLRHNYPRSDASRFIIGTLLHREPNVMLEATILPLPPGALLGTPSDVEY